jgi:hypothetical protein
MAARLMRHSLGASFLGPRTAVDSFALGTHSSFCAASNMVLSLYYDRNTMKQQTIQASWQGNWTLWLWWLIVSLVGGIAAAFVIYPIAQTLFFRTPDELTAILASRLIPGALLGAILGVMQSLLFRRCCQQALRWIVLCTLGWTISSLIGEIAGGMLSRWIQAFVLEPDPTYAGVMNIPARFIPLLQFAHTLGSGFVGGAIVGGLQVIYLRRFFRHTLWWVLGSALGWTAYVIFNWLNHRLNYDYVPMIITIGVSTIMPWVLYSAVTGYVLFWRLTFRSQPNNS